MFVIAVIDICVILTFLLLKTEYKCDWLYIAPTNGDCAQFFKVPPYMYPGGIRSHDP
jgi:hypothetical protein